MPVLNCYVDEFTLDILRDYSARSGRSIEDLAEAAICDAAVRSASHDEGCRPGLPLGATAGFTPTEGGKDAPRS